MNGEILSTMRIVNEIFLPWLQLIALCYIAIGVRRDKRG
jgi:hypothetical protein